MSVKIINVRYGQIELNFPDDLLGLTSMLTDILNELKECNSEITYENEEKIDKKFRKYASRRFEKFFGLGSCKKVFGTHLPSYKAYEEFSTKINMVIDQWITDEN